MQDPEKQSDLSKVVIAWHCWKVKYVQQNLKSCSEGKIACKSDKAMFIAHESLDEEPADCVHYQNIACLSHKCHSTCC